VLLSRAGCRLAPVLCVASSRTVELGPADGVGLVARLVASCFREERLGPANEVRAQTADRGAVSRRAASCGGKGRRDLERPDAETSESAGCRPIRRRRPVRGSDGTPPFELSMGCLRSARQRRHSCAFHEGGASAVDVLAAQRTKSAGPQRSTFRLRTAGGFAVTLAGARSKTAGAPMTRHA
jgi:hypothetical protein